MANIEGQDKNDIMNDTASIESDLSSDSEEYYTSVKSEQLDDDYDNDDNITMPPTQTSQSEKQKEFHSEIPVKELTDFVLEKLFFERQKLYYSDGCLYRQVGSHLELISKNKLEALVLEVLNDEFTRIGKRSRIKAVSDLIMLRSNASFININRDRKLIAFSDGILDVDNWKLYNVDIFEMYYPSDINCMYELPFDIGFESAPPDFAISKPYFINKSTVMEKLPVYTANESFPCGDAINIYNRNATLFLNNPYVNYQPAYFYRRKTIFQYNLIQTIANCPTPDADKFFLDIADGDLSIVERIYQMIGCILVPGNEAKAYFLLQGESDSGKSVLGKFLEGYFPPELVTSLDISRLGEQYLPKEFATSCLNLSMDLPNGKMSAKSAATLKMLTGDDLITHEVKYKDAKPYRCRCKFVFSTNFPLEMTVYDEAFLNRTVCIPFTKTIPKEKQDAQLLSKLNAERPAITTKAILLYYFLKENKFKFSGADKIKPKVNYRMDINETIKAFIDTKCSITYNNEDYVSTRDLYNAYIEFCNDSGITYNGNMNGFSQRVHNLCYPHIESDRKRENNEHIRGYKGIKVYTRPYIVSNESGE